MLFLITILLITISSAAGISNPIFLYSHDGGLLAGRNHYMSKEEVAQPLFHSDTQHSLLPTTLFSPHNPYPQPILSLLLLTDESSHMFATTDSWLKNEYVSASSSVVVPHLNLDIVGLVTRSDVEEVNAKTLEQKNVTLVEHLMEIITSTPTKTMFVLRVASLEKSGMF